MKKLTLFAVVALSGCAQHSAWTPTVDPYGSQAPVQQYQAPQQQQYQQAPNNSQLKDRYYTDLAECKQLAQQASGSIAAESGKGAVGGALIGAAGGAIIGAITGNAGAGAAIGAAAGGVGGATRQGLTADEAYKRSYNNCMSNRGHNVVY